MKTRFGTGQLRRLAHTPATNMNELTGRKGKGWKPPVVHACQEIGGNCLDCPLERCRLEKYDV